MKKLLIAILMLATGIVANAQIKFGVKAGVNIANVHASQVSSIESFNSNTSFHAGGLVSIPLVGKLELQPEIMFSGEGTKYTNDGDNYTYNFGYINIPVLLKIKAPMGLFAELGPQFGIVASAKAKFNGTTQDIKGNFKSTDISGCVGVGYLSPLNLGIDARYTMGLTDISSGSGNSNGTVKNNVIQLGVFYMFGSK